VLEDYPKARFHIQDEEMIHVTGRARRNPILRRPRASRAKCFALTSHRGRSIGWQVTFDLAMKPITTIPDSVAPRPGFRDDGSIPMSAQQVRIERSLKRLGFQLAKARGKAFKIR
jgi:hypothetical protein